MWPDRIHCRVFLIGALSLICVYEPQSANAQCFHQRCRLIGLSCGGARFVFGNRIYTNRTRCKPGETARKPPSDSPIHRITILGTLPDALKLQQAVYDDTLRLAALTDRPADCSLEVEASRLSNRQRQIAGPLDALIERLRQEGASAAFPEVLEQLRAVMHEVAGRLGNQNTGRVTQAIQLDIINSLEEILAGFR